MSPDGRNVYVASYNDDAVTILSRDASDNGKLSFIQVLKGGPDGVDGLDGARSVTVSPDGKNVYVASFGDNAVAIFSRDASDNGKLSFIQVLKDGQNGVGGLDGAN